MELLGVDTIDKQFSDIVKNYEKQFQNQMFELQKSAGINLQDTLMRTGEAVGGKLGTGAAADFRQDTANLIAETEQNAASKLTEQLNKSVDSVTDMYTDWFTQTFGELTDAGYANLVEYEQMADEFSMGVLTFMADLTGVSYTDRESLFKGLTEIGFMEGLGNGEYQLTSKGQTYFENILINPSEEYGNHDLTQRVNDIRDKMVDNYMARVYPTLDSGDTYDAKKAQIAEKFDAWLQKNSTSAYYTHLELATITENGFEIKGIDYGIPTDPEIDTEILAGDGSAELNYKPAVNVTDDWFGEFSGSQRENSNQTKYLSGMIADMRDGTMPAGSYFIANYGAASESAQLFYYDGTNVYKTEYTLDNMPKMFAPAQLYGFGRTGMLNTDDANTLAAVANGRYSPGDKLIIHANQYTVARDTDTGMYVLTDMQETPFLADAAWTFKIGWEWLKGAIDSAASWFVDDLMGLK